MSSKQAKGRPAARRQPASFRTRLMGWVNRVTPWFGVAVIALAAVWLGFAVFDIVRLFGFAAGWSNAAVYAASFVGAICMGPVAVRVASPSRNWPPDGAVRVLATLGLVLGGIAAPLIVLRPAYGMGGIIVAVVPLIVFYVRIRRPLVDVLPAWCGGTWKPDKSRPRRSGEEVIKRPPRSWDETSGPGPAQDAPTGARPQRKKSKKKRRGR